MSYVVPLMFMLGGLGLFLSLAAVPAGLAYAPWRERGIARAALLAAGLSLLWLVAWAMFDATFELSCRAPLWHPPR